METSLRQSGAPRKRDGHRLGHGAGEAPSKGGLHALSTTTSPGRREGDTRI